MTEKRKTSNNQCPSCEKTHEKCADDKTCPKWEISLAVCRTFGTRR